MGIFHKEATGVKFHRSSSHKATLCFFRIVNKKTDEWYIECQRMTTSANELQRMATSENKWQRVTTNDNE